MAATIVEQTPKAGSKCVQRISYPTKGGQVLAQEPLKCKLFTCQKVEFL